MRLKFLIKRSCLLLMPISWFPKRALRVALTFCFVSIYSHALTSDLVMSGFGDVIWSLEFVNPNQALMALRDGRLWLVDLKRKSRQEISGGPTVAHGGQGGLLDLALDPQFKKNRTVFMTFSEKVGDGKTTSLARAKLNIKQSRLENLKVLFRAQPVYSTSHHFGSRLAFDLKGHLFMSVGDRGNRDYAQDLSRHNGKILRLDKNGAPAKGNPFEEQKRVKPEIWSYGHRNPQGMVFDPKTSQLWIHEHGPRGGDEINLVKRAKNYGWPEVTHGQEYIGGKIGEGLTEKHGMEPPAKVYVPSIAPSGMELVENNNGDRSFFIGALALTHLNQVRLTTSGSLGGELRHLEKLEERIRDVKLNPNKDALYITTDSGRVYTIRRPF